MLETKTKEVRKNMFKKETKYVEDTVLGSSAIKKEKIVKEVASIGTQLNLLRKAVLGDAEALKELQVIEDYINGL